MYSYDVKVTWREGKQGVMRAAGKPAVNVATPSEFGGPDGVLTPEELLVASVASCLMTTFLYFVELLRIGLLSYESNATGVMEKTPDGLRFTKMDVWMCGSSQTLGPSPIGKRRSISRESWRSTVPFRQPSTFR